MDELACLGRFFAIVVEVFLFNWRLVQILCTGLLSPATKATVGEFVRCHGGCGPIQNRR